jgi:hypothetical protein
MLPCLLLLLVGYAFAQSPRCISPKNNLFSQSANQLFVVEQLPYATSFKIQISTTSNFQTIILDTTISANSFNNTFNINQNTSYYWRNKVYYSNDSTDWSTTFVLNIFSPKNIPNLLIWLSGKSLNQPDNTPVSLWNDQTSYDFDAIQNNNALRPIYKVSGGVRNNPFVDFTSHSLVTTLNNSWIRNDSTLAFFTLCQNRNQGYGALFYLGNSGSFSPAYAGRTGGSSYSNGAFRYLGYNGSSFTFDLQSPGATYKVISGFDNRTNSKLFSGGIQSAASSVPVPVPVNSGAVLKIGSNQDATENYSGRVHEFLVMRNSTDESLFRKIETFIDHDYVPRVNLGGNRYRYTRFCDSTITLSAGTGYANYNWSNGAITSSINVGQFGTYSVIVTDELGYKHYDTIEYRPYLRIDYPSKTSICSNDSIEWNPNIQFQIDSIVWSDGLVANSRYISDMGTYSFTIYDQFGCSFSSNSRTFTIDSFPLLNTLPSDTSLCSGNSISALFLNEPILSYNWNTNSNLSSTVIDTTGSYTLTTLNQNNCSNTSDINISVVGIAPILNFSIPNEICQFDSLIFNDSSFVPDPYSISEVKWIFHGVDTLSQLSGSYLPQTSGSLNVKLEVNSAQCQSSTNFNVVVHPKPIVSFTTEKFCPYDAVEFTVSNSQLSAFSSQLWSFDDNTTSTSPNPTHVFGTSDTYNVSLQAEDINGCRDTVIQTVYIQPQPVADFTFNNTCELSAVNFVNNSSITDTFSLSLSQWTYGDGTQATNPSFQKVYQAYGDYDVQLVVTANNGCQDTLTQTITIHPKPILGWQVGPACKNTWTTFENQSTIPLGSVTQTDWLINLQYPLDGTSSAYKFVTTGVQYLNLTSTSDQGCTTDTLIIVNVQPEINAAYTVFPTTVVAGVPVIFTNTSLGGTQFEWNLGNGNVIQTPVAEPVEATGFASSFIGDSILTYLAIQNAIGCKDTAYQYVKINEPRIDLAINQLFVQDINGFYKVGVELRNLGFVEITQTDLLLKLYNSSPIIETETESLAPGESRIYLFNANPSAFVSTQDKEISYLCVEAKSYNDYQLIETELSNNISCLNTEGGNFVLLPIFPNPTNDDITYTLIVSEESTISTSLTDETGRIVQSSTELFASGLHTPTLSMRNLSAGVYYFQISDGVTSKTVKVLKN